MQIPVHLSYLEDNLFFARILQSIFAIDRTSFQFDLHVEV